MDNKTSIGLPENVAGLLCYLLTFVSGFVILLLEQENRFVRFHALQSIIIFVPLFVLSWIPAIGWIFWAAAFILWIITMVRAYQGVMYKVPGAGNLAEKWLGKV